MSRHEVPPLAWTTSAGDPHHDQELMTVLQDWISAIEGWVPMLAESLWVYPALMLFATVDGFFPPVPSETALVAVAAVTATSGQPVLAVVLGAAALGAIAGDSIAYAIGRRVGLKRLRNARRPRIAAAFAFAERQIARRAEGASFEAIYAEQVGLTVPAGS